MTLPATTRNYPFSQVETEATAVLMLTNLQKKRKRMKGRSANIGFTVFFEDRSEKGLF